MNKIEVNILFESEFCYEENKAIISSSLRSKIKSLDSYKLTLKGNNNSKKAVLIQDRPTEIIGFLEVLIENITIKPKNRNS